MNKLTFWEIVVPRVMTLYANLIFLILWVGFIAALRTDPAWLDSIWLWTNDLPLVLQIILWVFFLPIYVGLWIWESSWSTGARLAGLGFIIFWNLLAISGIFKEFIFRKQA